MPKPEQPIMIRLPSLRSSHRR